MVEVREILPDGREVLLPVVTDAASSGGESCSRGGGSGDAGGTVQVRLLPRHERQCPNIDLTPSVPRDAMHLFRPFPLIRAPPALLLPGRTAEGGGASGSDSDAMDGCSPPTVRCGWGEGRWRARRRPYDEACGSADECSGSGSPPSGSAPPSAREGQAQRARSVRHGSEHEVDRLAARLDGWCGPSARKRLRGGCLGAGGGGGGGGGGEGRGSEGGGGGSEGGGGGGGGSDAPVASGSADHAPARWARREPGSGHRPSDTARGSRTRSPLAGAKRKASGSVDETRAAMGSLRLRADALRRSDAAEASRKKWRPWEGVAVSQKCEGFG